MANATTSNYSRTAAEIRLAMDEVKADPDNLLKLPYYVGGSRERQVQIETLESIGLEPIYGEFGSLYVLNRQGRREMHALLCELRDVERGRAPSAAA